MDPSGKVIATVGTSSRDLSPIKENFGRGSDEPSPRRHKKNKNYKVEAMIVTY